MKVTREVKTGILVILGIALFIVGFNYLKGQNLLDSSNIYYTEFEYNALSKSSAVTVKGNVVGKIKDIAYDYDSGKTRVTFAVNSQLKFSKNSRVKLYETGLMGGSALAILVENDGEIAQSGDVIQSYVEPGLVTSLSKNFSGISSELNSTLRATDTLLISMNELVKDNSEKGLKATIAELNGALKSLKYTSNSVNGLLNKNDENIAAILENFKNTSADLAALSEELKNAEIGQTVTSLNKTLQTLNSVLAGMEKGEGSMGKLLKDEALYNNLQGASQELEALLRDIKLHPKRYFRILSKKEIPYQEGEETE
ncbi:MCE family protein [Tamlana fucoidanivorans]|uniref:MCE family protein n=1 Tax=Allotamlana fucoidanivorans TaxID=2583814 RepID=A0A5C4SQP5_9FLAO|nr:MlaD family protein [Tamlana fucoidanivorans]TNJ46616.1 MCE family protein [Tamlana fucoidanivorans]